MAKLTADTWQKLYVGNYTDVNLFSHGTL